MPGEERQRITHGGKQPSGREESVGTKRGDFNAAVPAYFFFSDAHLGAPHSANDAERRTKVLEFLEYVKTHGAGLFIVGDLFDFWFEYRHAILNRHFAVLAKLHELSHHGLPVDYLAGNHDMWLGDFLREQVGLNIHHQGLSRMLYGYKCFITHGDGTAKRDRGYRILKKVMKHPVNVFLYRMLSPDLGVPLANFMSGSSRKYKERDSSWDREYREYGLRKLAEGYDVFMMGHTHKPILEQIEGKTLINLGDWMKRFTYCRMDENGPRLLTWPER